MDQQDQTLYQLLVARQVLPPDRAQQVLTTAQGSGRPLSRYAAETGCVDRQGLIACMREANGGIADDRGYGAVEDAQLASELISGGVATQDVIERFRADAFSRGVRLGDSLSQHGVVPPDRVSSCLSAIQARKYICPTCFSTFDRAWLQSVQAAQCPLCLEHWSASRQQQPMAQPPADDAPTIRGVITGGDAPMGSQHFDGMPTAHMHFAQTMMDGPQASAPPQPQPPQHDPWAQTVGEGQPAPGGSISGSVAGPAPQYNSPASGLHDAQTLMDYPGPSPAQQPQQGNELQFAQTVLDAGTGPGHMVLQPSPTATEDMPTINLPPEEASGAVAAANVEDPTLPPELQPPAAKGAPLVRPAAKGAKGVKPAAKKKGIPSRKSGRTGKSSSGKLPSGKAPKKRRTSMRQEGLIDKEAGIKGYLPVVALGLALTAGMIVIGALLLPGGNHTEGVRVLKEQAHPAKEQGELEKAIGYYKKALEKLASGTPEQKQAQAELEGCQLVHENSQGAASGDTGAADKLAEYAVTGGDLVLRLEALKVLSTRSEAPAPARLRDLIDKKGEDEKVKTEAIRALVVKGGDAAIDLWGRAIVDGLLVDSASKISSLENKSGPQAIAALIDILVKGKAQKDLAGYRVRACERLRTLGGAASAAIDPLIDAIKNDENDLVRAAAVRAAGDIDADKAAPAIVEALLAEGDRRDETIAACSQVLPKAGDAAVAALERELVAGEVIAAGVLAEIQTNRSAQALAKALSEGDWRVRSEVVAKVVEAEFPKNLSFDESFRDFAQKLVSGGVNPRPEALQVEPLVRAAEHFELEEEEDRLLGLQMYLDWKIMEARKRTLELSDQAVVEKDQAAGGNVFSVASGTGMSVGSGTIRVGLCTTDGNYAIGFQIVSGQKDEAPIRPGSYKLIFDNREGDANRPLLVKDVSVASGERLRVALGLVEDE